MTHNSTAGYFPNRNKHCVPKKSQKVVHSSFISHSLNWKPHKCPSTGELLIQGTTSIISNILLSKKSDPMSKFYDCIHMKFWNKRNKSMVVSFRISAYSRKQWPLTEKGNKGDFGV